MSNIIKIEGLRKTYDDGTLALDDVNLNIHSGEIISLLGPNGAGKTSLISTICGITKPTSGNIYVDGYDIKKDYRKTRKLIGLVPQEIALEPFEKVLDVIKYSRNLFGYSNDDKHIEKILKRLMLWDKRNKRIVELSGGMKRRVIIAKALSHNPKILFLDEPTAGVDVDLRIDMWKLIKQLRSDGVTVILTTHYIEEAEEISDRISIINNGKILLTEKKIDLIEKMGQKTITFKVSNNINLDHLSKDFDVSITKNQTHTLVNYHYKKTDELFNDFLSHINKLDCKILNIDTNEKSLEEIFLDVVGL
ncbi:MAG: ABC transporter ATP-binding protein [Alphaproteobacteria bacterium]|uniref:ABC transporter ATP-binding protein n=1 Tax=PS1 clade bacterium TaxID=2175152 RepID=A0A368DM59_9PROT|nr:multidrug ABC transporter ATP-binding protein [Rhodobiaceae bacterium]OUT73788.1 MAG: multidrug ABC transporter ATP-binding protein [Rhizobiales bacterium TMED25]RCL72275.1 MAG: ABC transporter ATP-binding protein [PS1 clade bacterium]|tara:strand:+ start:11258 stop:12175 length:918 start_codon:yes stop_codon:yes gene_type:complete